MKICFLSLNLFMHGGIQRIIPNIINGMTKEHEITIVMPYSNKDNNIFGLNNEIKIKNLNDFPRHNKYTLIGAFSLAVWKINKRIGILNNEIGADILLKTLYTDNLYCIDIICHGVPSPMVWKDYLIYCEKKYGGKVTEVEFINKKRFGWKAHKESVWINGKEYDNVIFTHLFRDHNILRPACYECPYKSIGHPGDITIGDAWGIDKVNPEFNDNKGVSLVLINSDKGKRLLQKTYNDIDKIEINVCDYMQTPLIRPYEKPCTREKFWKQYKNKGFSYIVSNYVELSWHKKIIRKFLKYTTRKKYE